jgi:mannose/fructose-specific phosphotransferase system component IIA
MATISQVPGNLNIRMTANQSMAFSCAFDGNLSADTWGATLNNGATTVTLTVSAVYDAVATTNVAISISAVQAQTLTLADYTWQLIQTTSGVARTVLAGQWLVVNGY